MIDLLVLTSSDQLLIIQNTKQPILSKYSLVDWQNDLATKLNAKDLLRVAGDSAERWLNLATEEEASKAGTGPGWFVQVESRQDGWVAALTNQSLAENWTKSEVPLFPGTDAAKMIFVSSGRARIK